MANTLREMKIKTTVRYHLTLVRMAIIKNPKIRNAGEGVGFPGGSTGKEFAYSVGDLGLIPGLGRSPGEGNGNPLQYSALENSMDCIVYGVDCTVYGEGVEKKGSCSTVGGNANWCRQYAEQYGDSLKTKNRVTVWLRNPTLGHIPRESCNLKRHMYPNVYSSTTYNNQDT